MRVVLDTNVVVSAIAFGGRTRLLAAAAESGRLVPVTTAAMVEEYKEVLARLRSALPFNAAAFDRWLQRHCELAAGPVSIPRVCRDPDDDLFVAVALLHDLPLCSGDKDLLALRGTVVGLEILTAAELLARLEL